MFPGGGTGTRGQPMGRMRIPSKIPGILLRTDDAGRATGASGAREDIRRQTVVSRAGGYLRTTGLHWEPDTAVLSVQQIVSRHLEHD